MTGKIDNRVSLKGLKRALVIEQLSDEQWHLVAGGAAIPADSPAAEPSGAGSRFNVMVQAMSRARLFGRPVVVQPLGRPMRWPTRDEVRCARFGPRAAIAALPVTSVPNRGEF